MTVSECLCASQTSTHNTRTQHIPIPSHTPTHPSQIPPSHMHLLLPPPPLSPPKDLEVLQIMDKLFAHCLTAIATSFANHLQAAVKRVLNPWAEYKSNEEGSELWLQLIVNKGVLVYLECTMATKVEGMVALKDMEALLPQIRNITLHVSETETSGE